MTSKTDLTMLRKDFPMLAATDVAREASGRHVAYLDNASSSQTPEPVLTAMDAYYRGFRANVHRGMYKASAVATEHFEEVRRIASDFLRAGDASGKGGEGEIVFTRGTTESLNIVASGLAKTLGPGDEVVLTVMEHHANLVPWQQAAKARGFSLKCIPLTATYDLDMNAARAMIGPKTRVLAVTMVSNVLGTIVPVAELASLAKRHGAAVVVDAAQAAGHLPIDVRKLGADFVAFSGHKMLGPTGVGVLWGRRAALEALPPFQFGGDMIRDVTFEDATWNDVPWKFEAGTPDIAGVLGLGAAMRYLSDAALAARAAGTSIGAQETALANVAIARLQAIPGVAIVGPGAGEHRTGVVSFVVEGTKGGAGIHPHDLATILDAEGVAVRGGHHCAMPLLKSLGRMDGTTRASFAFYNEDRDIDALIAGIEKARKIFRLA